MAHREKHCTSRRLVPLKKQCENDIACSMFNETFWFAHAEVPLDTQRCFCTQNLSFTQVMLLTHKDFEGGVSCGMHMMCIADSEDLCDVAQPYMAQGSEVQKRDHQRDCVLV